MHWSRDFGRRLADQFPLLRLASTLHASKVLIAVRTAGHGRSWGAARKDAGPSTPSNRRRRVHSSQSSWCDQQRCGLKLGLGVNAHDQCVWWSACRTFLQRQPSTPRRYYANNWFKLQGPPSPAAPNQAVLELFLGFRFGTRTLWTAAALQSALLRIWL